MKTKILFSLVLVMMTFIVPLSYGQIEVQNDNTVKITENVTVTRNDSGNPKMEMNLNYNNPSSSDVVGFKIHSTGTSNYRYGINNFLSGTTNYETGIFNDLNSHKLNSTLSKQGIYNRIYQNDATYARGMRNLVYSANESFYSQTYGLENQVQVQKSQGESYGCNNLMQVESTVSAGTVIAVNASIVQDYYSQGGAAPYNYGIKSYLDPSFNGYAGYFQGDVSVFGTFYNGSDDRLKENVQELESGLELIRSLKPKQYSFKRDLANESRKEKTSFGFIAQDVQRVAPDLVKLIEQEGETKVTELSPERYEIDSNGERVIIPADIVTTTEMDGEPMYAIAYLEFIPFIVDAIQEQDEQIKALTKTERPGLRQEDGSKIQELELQLIDAEEKYNALAIQIAKILECTDCEDIDVTSRERIDLDLEHLAVKLYPNPVSNVLNIEAEVESTGLFEISVFDLAGQRIAFDKTMLIIGKNVHQMNVTDWISGTYYITTTFNDISSSNKIVVE